VAQDFYSVVANMRGSSAEEVAELVLSCPGLEGLQGPTIAPVYTKHGDEAVAQHGYYATTICVRKKQLYRAVKELRAVRSTRPGGGGWFRAVWMWDGRSGVRGGGGDQRRKEKRRFRMVKRLGTKRMISEDELSSRMRNRT
jgi:hypothetical protein